MQFHLIPVADFIARPGQRQDVTRSFGRRRVLVIVVAEQQVGHHSWIKICGLILAFCDPGAYVHCVEEVIGIDWRIERSSGNRVTSDLMYCVGSSGLPR